MGNQCIKPNNHSPRPPPPPAAAPESNSNSGVSTDLSSYQTACEEDPELQRFDSALQARTSLALNSIAANMGHTSSLSLDSLRDLTLCFLEMNQGVVNFILASKKDIWNDPDIFDLVEDYLNSSIHIMNFCSALDDSLERARYSQSIILAALTKFENESNQGDSSKLLFSETLEQLKSFKDAGDPFTANFFASFRSVSRQQDALLTKLKSKINKVEKKLGTLRMWRRVSNIILATVFVSAIICSIVAAAVTAPPVVTALTAAASVPVGTAGSWINSMWNKYENELMREKEILTLMEGGTSLMVEDLKHIQVVVDKLQIIIEGLLHSADFAIRQTDAVTIAMGEVKRNVNGFSDTIDVLSRHAKKCNQDITMARTVILRKMIVSQPSSSTQGFGTLFD